MLYVDTSAFLKVMVAEAESTTLRRALDGAELWSSTLLDVEAHRAGRRLGIDPAVVAVHLEAVSRFVPTDATFAAARDLGPASLRTLDALHLASALELGTDLEAVVTYDRRLATGCAAAGTAVLAPGRAAAWWAS